MKYTWDPEKEELNIKKHHVDFSVAAKALESGTILCEFYDEVNSTEHSEDRYIAIVSVGIFLMVIYQFFGQKTLPDEVLLG